MSAQYAERLVAALREARGFLEEDFPGLRREIGELFRDRDSSGLERQAERLAGGCAVDGVLFALNNLKRDVEAFDGESVLAKRAASEQARRDAFDAAAAKREAARVAAAREVDAAESAVLAMQTRLRVVDEALRGATIEDAMSLPDRGREHFAALAAQDAALRAELAQLQAAHTAARARAAALPY